MVRSHGGSTLAPEHLLPFFLTPPQQKTELPLCNYYLGYAEKPDI